MKKTANRIISLLLAAATAFLLAACARIDSSVSKNDTPSDEKTEEAAGGDITEVPEKSEDDGIVTVCIDPGHGFGDIGCENDLIGGFEKDLTLELANALKKSLEQKGVRVFLTHDGRSFPSASEIMREADALGVDYNPEKMDENDVFGKYERVIWENVLDRKYSLDMFVSLHINSIEGHPEVSGASVDYCSENPSRKMLASFCKTLSAKLTGEGLCDDCTIFEDSPDDAYVLTKYSTCPSVLIEAGYATNAADARNMTDAAWQARFSDAICETVLAHAGK